MKIEQYYNKAKNFFKKTNNNGCVVNFLKLNPIPRGDADYIITRLVRIWKNYQTPLPNQSQIDAQFYEALLYHKLQ